MSLFARVSRARLLAGTIGLGLALAAMPASGQEAPDDDVSNPPLLKARAEPPRPLLALAVGATPEALPEAASAERRDKILDLTIQYLDGRIRNPASKTQHFDKVHLRSYVGTDTDPKNPFISPMIEVVPGDTVRIDLHNKLDPDPSCLSMSNHNADTPHCFNGTNLHTHGLWVNPAGNGDNVLLSINPGVDFTYEYNIPSDHPSGTFWYHTHRHGSTALQVSSGMAGALIVRGNRLPTTTKHGDIDTLLRGMTERVLVMQQIQYACRGPAPAPGKLGPIKETKEGRYICDKDDVGGIEGYDQFGPGSWPASGRFTSINGKVLPFFRTTQGKIERWRMIHGGVRDTVSLQFFKLKPGKLKAALPRLTPETQSKAIADLCSGTPLPYTVIAADGLTMASGKQRTVATFQPGYRYDALVVFPEAEAYCVIDSSAPKSGTVNGIQVGPQLLGIVRVAPGTPVPNIGDYVRDALVANANQAMPADVKPAVVADLTNGLKFTNFTPHPDIADDEVTGKQELTFFIQVPPKALEFQVGNTLDTKDAQPYDPNRIDRKLTLGGVDEWTLQSHYVSHPFHIHVNPFQIVSIKDPMGNEVSAPGSQDKGDGVSIDPQYEGLQGVWKDTLWIKSLIGEKTPPPPGSSGIYTIKIRTRYERYIGQYVLHCHILDHEDQGMMQNVEVVVPQVPVRSPIVTPLGAIPPGGAAMDMPDHKHDQ